jgi:hypothetical protein
MAARHAMTMAAGNPPMNGASYRLRRSAVSGRTPRVHVIGRLSALLLIIALGSRAGAANVDVYVLTGQSNSLGTTADPAESNVGPGSDASEATTRFFWSNVSSANGTYPIGARYGDSAGLIASLQAQQGDGGANSRFWGPEIGFARAMSEAGHDNVMVIKASRGGGGNTLWSKAAFESTSNSGHMYQHVLDTVHAATAELTGAGHTFRIAGLMYLQGESDSLVEAGVAGQRFAELVSNLRIDLPYAANMHSVIGGIAAVGATRDLMRSRQSALAHADPTIDYFTNLDLAGSLYDGLHFNKPAKLEIGRRYAHRFLQAAGELPLIESSGFAAVADAANATRVVFDEFVPDANGPQPGTNLVHEGVFSGLADGLNDRPRVGLLVDASDNRVAFGDRHPLVPSSDLVVGTVDVAPLPRVLRGAASNTASGEGRSVRFTFVDPLQTSRKATVAGVAFELGYVAPEDQITVTFLDAAGSVLHRTGELSTGSFGFVSRDRAGGESLSNIHQVVIAGAPSAAWTIGHARSVETPDFAFQGFRIVPEPSGRILGAVAAIGGWIVRRRQCRLTWGN